MVAVEKIKQNTDSVSASKLVDSVYLRYNDEGLYLDKHVKWTWGGGVTEVSQQLGDEEGGGRRVGEG